MAQIVLGPLVANIAGSIGGTTFQRSPGGVLVRNKPNPIRRRTSFTFSARQETAFLSREWRLLDPADRADWQTTANSITWVNRFGDVVPGRGYWLYLRCNQFLKLAKGAYRTKPAPLPSFPVMSDLVCAAQVGVELSLDWSSPSPTPTGWWWVVSFSPPGSPGRSSPFSAFRICSFIDNGSIPRLDFYTAWLNRFGVVPVAGQQVFAQVQAIDTVGGYAAPPLTASAIFAP